MSRSMLCCVLVANLLLLASLTTRADQVYRYHRCSEFDEYFESKSAYAAHLDTVLSTFSSLDQTNNGFYNLSLGQDEDQIISIALCRGDVSESSCLECIKFGTADLPPRCPSQMIGIVWYDDCMFRYTNWYLFRSLDEGSYVVQPLSNGTIDSSHAEAFNKQLYSLLEALRDRAADGNSTLKFAAGSTSFTGSSGRIDAFVQCIPDLDQMQCASCLDHAFRDIVVSIPGRAGGRVLGASCSLLFNVTRAL
uniref:Gnk2-homologous domain-containing protein n=1 Tax=Kalanchoe fedtschenkoi TaxID=63787 RepID=A0A7N0TP03_KALFE